MTICYPPRIERVPAMFDALSSRNRRAILHMVGTTNYTATDMAWDLGITQQAASRHIAVLQRAGLVTRLGWEGYTIDAGGIAELERFIREYFPPPDRNARRAVWM